ncbi:MAG: type IV pilin N-terminal domain-containing protein, partial [ANME-2 cluster archaeon]|nr:type IV pilin N-terminal domain-containing protein [ANME-2 cluster archaeon]
MKANRKFTRDEDAVSPVIGVILMVAITVILAAVIAAFVFGMGSSLSKQYVVAATVSQISSSKIDITYAGGPDADALDYINISVVPSSGGAENTSVSIGDMGDEIGVTPTTQNPRVGTSVSVYQLDAFAGRDHVVLTATFMDGTQQVILDTYL